MQILNKGGGRGSYHNAKLIMIIVKSCNRALLMLKLSNNFLITCFITIVTKAVRICVEMGVCQLLLKQLG